jgi:hypothetical protein
MTDKYFSRQYYRNKGSEHIERMEKTYPKDSSELWSTRKQESLITYKIINLLKII